MTKSNHPIPALKPNGVGNQFAIYADSCSGIPDGSFEQNFAAVNHIVSRLTPQPEFICFPGDEIKGLAADPDQLREQWRYWLDVEMAWLDKTAVPVYHTTGNHTAYDPVSNSVFRELLAHLPQNGPIGQEGLTYFVRRDDLLMIFVNTLNEELGGEGWVETDWLEQTLQTHADAKYKLVFGHHPVFSVNGFSGAHQRDIEAENGRRFWDILVNHQVIAYVCSHILAFDVQVHQGVLQILTGGAGTLPRMPEGVEYLHCLQAALDSDGLRVQVLDTAGAVREWLKWPVQLPDSAEWGHFAEQFVDDLNIAPNSQFTAFKISGICKSDDFGTPQTLLCSAENGSTMSSIWIGLRGKENQLCVLIIPEPGRSPRFWLGPTLSKETPFEIQLGFHSGMGPGGLLWRWNDSAPWSSLRGTTAWGVEKVPWPTDWHIGQDQFGKHSRPFRGSTLKISFNAQQLKL